MTIMTTNTRSAGWRFGMAICCLLAAGCGRGVSLVPVAGRVTLDGSPLETGAVMIQPKAGPAAQAKIAADGTFRLGTFKPGDGAIPGAATVRVTCRKELTQPGVETAYGPSMIPEKYTQFDTSGITVDITDGMPPLEVLLLSR
jgi:hypothetical protein